MNKENLQRAADLLKNIDQSMFDMSTFREGGDFTSHQCNSVACIVGHATILDPDPLRVRPCLEIDFFNWSVNFFDVTYNEWEYLFSQEWRFVDNSIEGAIKRIKYVIKNGIPETWEEEHLGHHPLSYLK